MKTDREIQGQVQQELRWDTRIDATEIGVAVEGSIVSLSGTVKSFAERRAAQEAALRVTGVHDVANDVEVKVPGHLTLGRRYRSGGKDCPRVAFIHTR